MTCGRHSARAKSTSDVSKLCHSRSGHGSFDLKNTSGAFSTVDIVQWKDNVSGIVEVTNHDVIESCSSQLLINS